MTLVLCTPQFSEGRRPEVLESLLAAIGEVSDVRVLASSLDPDHHRCEISFVAPPAQAGEAVFRAAARATEAIDLGQHTGEHPRIGATDLVSFCPLGATLADCVEIAYATGERIGEELSIPIYYYAEAARRDDRRELLPLRRGQFEGLREAIGSDPTREPDAGPRAQIHPTAGATAIGAHAVPVDFELRLGSRDLALAGRVAAGVRERSGGLAGVRALALELEREGAVGVAARLSNYETNGLLRVYEEVERLAVEEGVEIGATQIVGRVPRAALPDGLADRIQLAGFDARRQVLEELI